ncbi:BON domain-containing protein [Pleurocapsales cyanobacterium LEGE 06147]|nr:BON domain-containing protein [Pleurocapsales cyanobacterium LEGE 06147]
MNKLIVPLLSSIFLFGAVACNDAARTDRQAPDEPGATLEAPTTEEAQESQEDATSDVRRDQLDSDIRAREERREIFNDGQAERDDGDLQSEVRSKLEANLPASALVVESNDGVVTISGTVPTQEQYNRIEPLAREIDGVREVNVDAIVQPAQPES